LIEAARSLNQKPKEPVADTIATFEPSTERPGDLFNADPQTPHSILQLLLKHGWTLDHETEDQWFLKHPGNRVKEHSTALSKSNGFLHTFSPNTPFEQNKNVPPFEVFAILETGGDFTRAASLLADDGFTPPTPNVDLSGILSQSSSLRAKKDDDNLFKIWTCPELMQADLQQEFLIENVLVEGQPCIIGGPKKCLKTSIMLDMAVALATGVPFLRCFTVPVPKRVLVMSGESGLVTIRNTIRRIADSIDLAPQEITGLFICDRVPRLDNLTHIAILKKTLESFRPDVVVFDPAYLMLTTDRPESLFATGGQLSAISWLCQIHGATIIIAHHNSKSSNVLGRTPDLDDLSWSGFAEFARQWILVSRNKAYDPMTGDQHIKMVVGGSYGHGGEYDIHIQEGVFPERRWDVEMMDLNRIVGQAAKKPSLSERKEKERQKRILEVLTGADEPLTKNRLVALTGINHHRIAKTLEELIHEGIIQESSDQQYVTYHLQN
jgi:predicted transcriptional regulator